MKTVVMIPTFNEKENISELINSILALNISNLSVVVDDNSPDGTGEVVKSIKNDKVELILRTDERGRGLAGKAGYQYALEHGADYIIEMDADFSHDPKYIPMLLEKIKSADVVLGSRGVAGGKESGRSLFRRIVTKGANLYIRIVLGIRVKDCNSGFRCFRRNVLEQINVENITSKGPAIVQEVLFKAHLSGFKIAEVPILFKDRELGESKLGLKQLAAGYFVILRLRMLSIFGKL